MMEEAINTSKDKMHEDILGYNSIDRSQLQIGDEVVITGISGVFPVASNVQEYAENLFNKVDMVTPNKKWHPLYSDLPPCSGEMLEINRYDAGFFGIHERQSQSMLAMSRVLQEKAIEAIFDAGLHFADLENTRTGVFIGACSSAIDTQFLSEKIGPDYSQMYAITGQIKSMIAHRLSYFLKLNGPSYAVDTACSSSFYALEHAYRAIRSGEVDSAIVGGVPMYLHPGITKQYTRLGALSRFGKCKVFCNSADGFVRSEAVVVVFLQKASNSKRVYAQIIHAKTNSDGFKNQGITYPSELGQTELLEELYDQCNVDQYSLSFMEAHGTGTLVGDPVECSALDSVLTKQRKTPLLIGSVKSNIGHTEPVSGLCALVKCIIAMETGFIPPNINFTEPNRKVDALIEGRMKVVTETTPLDRKGLVGINSYGWGGTNCHVLIRWNTKEKIHGGMPEMGIPRFVCISGRTEEAVIHLFDRIKNNSLDNEYIALLHNIFRKNISQHLYRGHCIVPKPGEVTRSIKKITNYCSPLYIVLGELHKWHQVGRQLKAFPVFADSIQRIHNYLLGQGININDLMINKGFSGGLYNLVASIAVQIGIIDMLNFLEIKAVGSFGYSYRNILVDYCSGLLTLEETLDRAVVINNIIQNFQQQNKQQGVLKCTEGKSNESWEIEQELLQNLRDTLRISPGCNKSFYIENALMNTSFQDVECVESNSVILKIGSCSHSNIYGDFNIISFGSSSEDYVTDILKTFGSLYENGYQPQIGKLYPLVSFPVSRGTPMIASDVKWNHRREVLVSDYTSRVLNRTTHSREITIAPDDLSWAYINDQETDGTNLFPASGYLYLVWETFALLNDMPMASMNVVLENCKFIRTTAISKKEGMTFFVTIRSSTGNFKVIEGGLLVLTGRISRLNVEKNEEHFIYQPANFCESMPLKTEDVYKELRLRGHNYRGSFRAIKEFNPNASSGYLEWKENWITFIDSMLQIHMLQKDTRLLHVLTYISRISINAKYHSEMIRSKYTISEKSFKIPIYSSTVTGIVSAGGVHIRGIVTSSIFRRKEKKIPLLEDYIFVPNLTTLGIEQSVRVNIGIILENTLLYKIKSIELIDEFTEPFALALTPIILSVLRDQPMTQPKPKIFSKIPLDLPVVVEDKELINETNCLLIIASSILTRLETLKDALGSLVEDGFIISRESLDFDASQIPDPNIAVLTEHVTSSEKLLLIRKQPRSKAFNCVRVSSDSFSWISKLQEALEINTNEDVVLYDNELNSGIIGLVNCLRLEDKKYVRCVHDMNMNKKNPEEVYANQLKKNMAINVFKNGQWGTYRHLRLDTLNTVESVHCYIDVITKGDLSTLRWTVGPLHHNRTLPSEKELIQVYYSALNSRDVMTALGKMNAEIITTDRLEQECVLGTEFSGRDKRGNRVMGIVVQGALSTVVVPHPYFTFKVPDFWTLEEAATVPMVYATVISGLFLQGQLKKGESILIHSGAGEIGQAAIRLALHCGCKVYTTVATQAKREFVKKIHPQLKDCDIGNSCDETFEQMIYKETNGKGVEMVLNSLAEEKLIASVNCLARGGRFIEIGKFDILNNNHISLLLLKKDATFVGTMMDQMFADSPETQIELRNRLIEGIDIGVIKPLSKTIFKYDEVETAFRFMAQGQRIGKVLIQIREPEEKPIFVPFIRKFLGIPRYYCNSEKTYVVVGGLGGFGLELADWLVLRGAKKLVLNSRKGITTGYQNHRIRIWRSYGTIINISTSNVATGEGCKKLIEESNALGSIEAIFNSAAVLADAMFENQTPEKFMTAFESKALATRYLDELSRVMCPDLGEFVIFSSTTCGRGYAGQTNYGMANSVTERICEKRKQEGYPALAIQWGAIGDVGIVAKMQGENEELELGGILQQPISNCLKVLDALLKHKSSAVVSSMVVAEKQSRSLKTNGVGGAVIPEDMVNTILCILGITDIKAVSVYSTLTELGMDSMTAVKVKQTLEKDFELFLTTKDVRSLTLARLKDIQNQNLIKNPIKDEKKGVTHFGLDVLLQLTGQDTEYISTRLKSAVDEGTVAPKVLLFPGVDGCGAVFKPLACRLNAHTICIQFTHTAAHVKTATEMAELLIPFVEENLVKNEMFTILAYSYGATLALEVVRMLESRGYVGVIICLDGAPFMVQQILSSLGKESEHTFQNAILLKVLALVSSTAVTAWQKARPFNCKSWEDRVNYATDIAKSISTEKKKYLKLIANGIYYRLKAAMNYTSSYTKLKSDIKLLKPKQGVVQGPEDYQLSEFSEKPVEVKSFEGTHLSLLQNKEVADTINSFLQKSMLSEKLIS